MSQTANPRRLPETQALARAKMIRTSAQKLNVVAAMIRGKTASAALASLVFCERRVAAEVKKVLQAAIANAENNHQLDVDRLVVAEAFVGKAMVMKRFSARARGRVGHIVKPFSNLTVIVREREESVGEEKA